MPDKNKKKKVAKKEPVLKEKIDYAELANLSGETTVKQRKYIVPILKFHGLKGEFSLIRKNSDGVWEPEAPSKKISGVILKVRRTLMAFEEVENTPIRYYTNEHNSFRDRLILFERRGEASKAQVVMEGTAEELKKNYPKLKLRQNLYFLLSPGGEVVKLGVKGKSLAALFEYYRDLGEEHIFQFITNIECHEETNKGGLTFYVMDFLKGDDADMEVISKEIKAVASSLNLQDSSYASSDRARKETQDRMAGGFPTEKLPEVPPKTEEKPSGNDDNGEEVDVKDIPF